MCESLNPRTYLCIASLQKNACKQEIMMKDGCLLAAPPIHPVGSAVSWAKKAQSSSVEVPGSSPEYPEEPAAPELALPEGASKNVWPGRGFNNLGQNCGL